MKISGDYICPTCRGKGKIKAPHNKQKLMDEKEKLAIGLRRMGFSIREIMTIMGYKSPRSVSMLLEKK